jgi:transcriptional repressor NrdR
MMHALQKRPVSIEKIDEAILRILHRLRATGEREVKARLVGELVMDELRQLDSVAYVRFASVYRSFQDISEFRTEIEKLERGSQDPA